MKIMLIYPGISRIGFNSFKKDNFLHHGLASIASYLTNKGHVVEFVDLRQLNGWDEFKKIIKKTDAQVIGITSTTIHFGYAIKCAHLIKKIRPDIKIISGGVHTTICPEDALRIKYFDYVITRLVVLGAVYLTTLCVLPEVLISKLAVPFYLGGTTLMIVVQVSMDFMTQVHSHLIAHQYEGLIKKAQLAKSKKGRRF